MQVEQRLGPRTYWKHSMGECGLQCRTSNRVLCTDSIGFIRSVLGARYPYDGDRSGRIGPNEHGIG